ncbi:lysine-specific demethylase JMJ705-like isoform X2 [Sesamum indicum]|uniref:Lysine-specific demethylase JMJ705-like isoform X2 n=1 Tax=Sesamum indicum TaxID=4182 RepID=A0A8M8UTC1_SESIN|nr:lysine-specific demethylase JMJ705-like isoform X2 [Sesamum indicum]
MMSLDVLLSAGVPWCSSRICCHFPRAYHSGFSPGYYCGDAADMANIESSSVAREAAIHSAAIRCPPMVSRFQLSYDLAVSLCSRQCFLVNQLLLMLLLLG